MKNLITLKEEVMHTETMETLGEEGEEITPESIHEMILNIYDTKTTIEEIKKWLKDDEKEILTIAAYCGISSELITRYIEKEIE